MPTYRSKRYSRTSTTQARVCELEQEAHERAAALLGLDASTFIRDALNMKALRALKGSSHDKALTEEFGGFIKEEAKARRGDG